MGYTKLDELVSFEVVEEMYLTQKMTVHEIAKKLGFSGAGIWKYLKRNGVKLRCIGPKGRPWGIKRRGKEFLGADGRWWVRGIRSAKKRSSKHRSVVVWEKYNGPVPKGYDVHHKNENKQDDSIGNLELVTAATHNSIHHLGKKNPKKASWGRVRFPKLIKGDLIHYYLIECLTQREIGEKFGVTQNAVSKALQKFGIRRV